MKEKEIRKIIKELGYTLSVGINKGTSVIETFISLIDGEKKKNVDCWSSKDYDWEFLEKTIKKKDLKGL